MFSTYNHLVNLTKVSSKANGNYAFANIYKSIINNALYPSPSPSRSFSWKLFQSPQTPPSINNKTNAPNLIQKQFNRYFKTFIKDSSHNFVSKGFSFKPDMKHSSGMRRLLETVKNAEKIEQTKTQTQTVQISEAESQNLENLKVIADEDKVDPKKQLNYMMELNRLGKHQEIVDRYESQGSGVAKFTLDENGRREFIKALVYLNSLERHPISTLVGLNSNQPGSSQSFPIYTARITDRITFWIQNSYNLIFIIFCLCAIYWFFSSTKGGGGGFGELLNSNVQSADTDVSNTFKDVKGSDEAKEELEDIVEYLKNPNKFVAMGARLPKGILLVGPPGCGKTLLAKALAGEAGVPFFYSSGSEFEEMLVGVGARRVRALFNKAKESAPCIIFIDEIDAVGGKRDSMDTRSSKMSLNQLLVEMDGFATSTGVVVVAATNMPKLLDPALVRPGRFDRQVSVTLPDIKTRREILEMYLGKHKGKDVNTDQLAKATVGFSGADLFNMVNTALISAVKKNMFAVNNAMLIHAKETVQMGPERKSMIITPETKKITAFHEAGHALISFFHKKSIVKATLMPRGSALGMVSYLPKDEMLIKKEDMLADLDSAMGGRVAEEIVFGSDKVTQGASSDFTQATQTAYDMVAAYGMSEKLGHIAFSRRELQEVSGKVRADIDNEVKRLLEDAYDRAKKTLTTHRNELNQLANALLEHETLTEDEVRLAIEGKDMKLYFAEKKRLEDEGLKKITPTQTLHKDTSDISNSKPNIQ